MELGVFSLTDIYPGSPDTAASRIDDIIGYGILAEQCGLDVFGIGEHHTRAFAVSSPAVVHAAIARATSRITLTTVAITSHFYIGDTHEQALHDFYPYYHRYVSPETNGGRGFYIDRNAMTSLAARRGALMAGGPAQVAEKILDLHAELGVDRFLGQVDLGGMPQQMVRDSIQRFGDIVAPAVHHVLTREQEHQPA